MLLDKALLSGFSGRKIIVNLATDKEIWRITIGTIDKAKFHKFFHKILSL